jgi:hypothetical protein
MTARGDDAMARRRLYRVGALLLAAVVGCRYEPYPQVPTPDLGAGPDAPKQAEPGKVAPWQRFGYTIQPLAAYDVVARVLSTSHYRLGREAELSPVDLALGWGPMADAGVRHKLSVSQGNRWYTYTWSGSPPLDPSVIRTCSANTHIIPGSADVDELVRGMASGDRVRLRGYLVHVGAADGWRWRSSLSRNDTGGGACELMWVTSVEVLDDG